jgi:two-component system nitrogen regulation response regulator GlnG
MFSDGAALEGGWLTAENVVRLSTYDWPGNVRQLRNIVSRLVLSKSQTDVDRVINSLSDKRTAAPGLPVTSSAAEPPEPAGPGKSAPRRRAEISDAELVMTLRDNSWNIQATARALNVSRPTLYAMIERCPGIRAAKDLTQAEIEVALTASAFDVEQASAVLEVSKRGLIVRMQELKVMP